MYLKYYDIACVETHTYEDQRWALYVLVSEEDGVPKTGPAPFSSAKTGPTPLSSAAPYALNAWGDDALDFASFSASFSYSHSSAAPYALNA